MDQHQWIAQFEAYYHRKPTAQEFQAAKERGEFLVQSAGPAPLAQPGKKKRLGLIIGLSAGGLTLLLAILAFVFLGRTPKISDLDGVWVNPADSITFVYEVNDHFQRFNGAQEMDDLTDGQAARTDFEAYLKDENESGIETLADFDRHFKLKTKAVFVASIEGKYSDAQLIYHLLQQDGSLIIFAEKDGFDSFTDDPETIERIHFYKRSYPQAFVGRWNVINKENKESREMTLSNYGVLTYRDDDGEEATDRVVPVPFEDYQKLAEKNPDKKFSQEEAEESLADVKEEVEGEGYSFDKKNVYIDPALGNYFVLVDGGQKVLVLDSTETVRASMEKLK